MALAAYGGLEAMKSAETKPKEWELGKPCAGKPPARFDEGASHIGGLPPRGSLYSTCDHETNNHNSESLFDRI